MLVTSVIQSFYTLNENTKRIDRDILLYGQTFYCVIAILPFPMVLGGLVIPRKTRVEKFGQGRFRTKIAILLTSSFILCLGACFRAGTNYAGGNRPIRDPANYQNKACFYIFNFTIEIVVILLYVVVRVDKRFWVPDHSKKAGDYSRRGDFYDRKGVNESTGSGGEGAIGNMIVPEEEVFDEESPEEVERGRSKRANGDEEKAPREEGSTFSLPPSTQQPATEALAV